MPVRTMQRGGGVSAGTGGGAVVVTERIDAMAESCKGCRFFWAEVQ